MRMNLDPYEKLSYLEMVKMGTDLTDTKDETPKDLLLTGGPKVRNGKILEQWAQWKYKVRNGNILFLFY